MKCNDWLMVMTEFTEPRHLMINISESQLGSLLPHSLEQLVVNATAYHRRVYPRGSRINSQNLDPSIYWRAGSQVAALNWQVDICFFQP
jgi:phosphatidylinositol phospholipase C delta